MHTGWKSRVRGARVFAKMPGGDKAFRKNYQGGSPYFGFNCVFINKSYEICLGAGGAYVYPPPYLCASMNEQKRVFQTVVRVDDNSKCGKKHFSYIITKKWLKLKNILWPSFQTPTQSDFSHLQPVIMKQNSNNGMLLLLLTQLFKIT
jgi:hypothetical protein